MSNSCSSSVNMSVKSPAARFRTKGGEESLRASKRSRTSVTQALASSDAVDPIEKSVRRAVVTSVCKISMAMNILRDKNRKWLPAVVDADAGGNCGNAKAEAIVKALIAYRQKRYHNLPFKNEFEQLSRLTRDLSGKSLLNRFFLNVRSYSKNQNKPDLVTSSVATLSCAKKMSPASPSRPFNSGVVAYFEFFLDSVDREARECLLKGVARFKFADDGQILEYKMGAIAERFLADLKETPNLDITNHIQGASKNISSNLSEFVTYMLQRSDIEKDVRDAVVRSVVEICRAESITPVNGRNLSPSIDSDSLGYCHNQEAEAIVQAFISCRQVERNNGNVEAVLERFNTLIEGVEETSYLFKLLVKLKSHFSSIAKKQEAILSIHDRVRQIRVENVKKGITKEMSSDELERIVRVVVSSHGKIKNSGNGGSFATGIGCVDSNNVVTIYQAALKQMANYNNLVMFIRTHGRCPSKGDGNIKDFISRMSSKYHASQGATSAVIAFHQELMKYGHLCEKKDAIAAEVNRSKDRANDVALNRHITQPKCVHKKQLLQEQLERYITPIQIFLCLRISLLSTMREGAHDSAGRAIFDKVIQFGVKEEYLKQYLRLELKKINISNRRGETSKFTLDRFFSNLLDHYERQGVNLESVDSLLKLMRTLTKETSLHSTQLSQKIRKYRRFLEVHLNCTTDTVVDISENYDALNEHSLFREKIVVNLPVVSSSSVQLEQSASPKKKGSPLKHQKILKRILGHKNPRISDEDFNQIICDTVNQYGEFPRYVEATYKKRLSNVGKINLDDQVEVFDFAKRQQENYNTYVSFVLDNQKVPTVEDGKVGTYINRISTNQHNTRNTSEGTRYFHRKLLEYGNLFDL